MPLDREKVLGGGAHAASGLASALGSLDLAASGPRRVIAAGAGLAGVAFFLPWAGVVIGANSVGGYVDRWGLAGPGHWIVLAAVVAIGVAAVAPGPLATRSIALPSIILAGVILGLIWPYLFGTLGPSIGVWTLLVAAGLLGGGGLLDKQARHDQPEPTV